VVCRKNVPIAEIKPVATLPNKNRPIGLADKEYPDFQISDASFEHFQVILLLLLMAKIRENTIGHLHFPLIDHRKK